MAVAQCKATENGDKVVIVNTEHKETGNQRCSRLSKRQLIFIIVALALALTAIFIILMIVLFTKSQSGTIQQKPAFSEDVDRFTTLPYPTHPPFDSTPERGLRILSRTEWLSQPPAHAPNPLKLPVHYVIISHTATQNCSNQADCTFHVRFIQTFDIESRNWWDIGNSFLVGGDGYAYEGRGWKGEGAHTYGYNAKSIGIAFIGSFYDILPPERQILAAKQLIQQGVDMGYIAPDYKILAASQLQTTQSPGLKLYENIKTWPHWAEKP